LAGAPASAVCPAGGRNRVKDPSIRDAEAGDDDHGEAHMGDQAGEPGVGSEQAPPWEPAEPPPWEVVIAAGAELGERPVWDPGRSWPTWVGINARRPHRDTPGRGHPAALAPAAGGRPAAI